MVGGQQSGQRIFITTARFPTRNLLLGRRIKLRCSCGAEFGEADPFALALVTIHRPATQRDYALMQRTMAGLESLDIQLLLPREACGRTLVACHLPTG